MRGDKAVSLLLVGVTAVEGEFEEGDIISIVDDGGNLVAVGRSGYGSDEATRLIGAHDMKPLVHYDYMYME